MSPQPINSDAEPTTWVRLLCQWAQRQPQQRAYTFLSSKEGDEAHLSYAELDCRARAIAARLQELKAEGKRVLLLYPSSLDYLAAFFGCLYAGAIAVPVYPPRPNRSWSRLQGIAQNSRAAFVLTTEAIQERAAMAVALDNFTWKEMGWISTDSLLLDAVSWGEAWREPQINGDSLAFLQYTSGSTAHPKGVMVSHANLLANHRMMQQGFGQDQHSLYVSWLPLFHDMGLIGAALQSLFLGSECVLMAPETFLVKPLRWLQAISRYRAHTSGAPNFAYDLCARKVAPEQRAALDLSSWKVAFNGAEPVRHPTLERFAQAFEPCGLQPRSLYPCYGLAEATLFVSGGWCDALPRINHVAAQELENDEVAELAPDEPVNASATRTIVGCGHAWLEGRIVIAHPQRMTRCEENRVGEIWVSGPQVAGGYWDKPEETARTFEAFLADTGEGPFLRTEDLGFIKDDELFITGRLKDLIVIAGRNYYPEEIEQTVEESHPAVRHGGCAAFSIEAADTEKLVIVTEVERHYRSLAHATMDSGGNPRLTATTAGADLIAAIRQAIAEQHDLRAHDVLLLTPTGLPKTSSGKVQRHLCRAGYLAGTLSIFAH